MIVKSMARKSATFGKLLDYFEAAQVLGPAFTHNLLSDLSDREAIRREFMANASLLPPRKNGNVLYHEILSFGAGDREQVTPAIIVALARRYLELRAPEAPAYVRVHLDTDCPHAHLLIGANNRGSRNRLRLSRRKFSHVKRELEQYQQEHFPELTHSLAQGRARKRTQLRSSRSEQERRRRGEQRLSRKETVRRTVSATVAVAQDGADCFRRLLHDGLRLYRRGKSIGVEDVASGRRFRLSTLGVLDSFEAARASWRQPKIRRSDAARVRSRSPALSQER